MICRLIEIASAFPISNVNALLQTEKEGKRERVSMPKEIPLMAEEDEEENEDEEEKQEEEKKKVVVEVVEANNMLS